MPITTKICGLSTREAVDTATAQGAAYLGFVFFPPSPRHVTSVQACSISSHAPCKKVAVTVNITDAEIEAILRGFTPNYLQLHGEETLERTAEIRARYQIPVIKAFSVRTREDIARARAYEAVADMLLFDARPPKNALLPGGNGVSFDWTLLRGQQFALPWFLSGGLSCQNIREAVEISGAAMVDVSSGVESAPGVKDLGLIRQFLELTAL